MWGWTGSIAFPGRTRPECSILRAPGTKGLAMEKVVQRFPDFGDENSYTAFG